MVEIKVLLFKKQFLFHYCQHIAMVIKDLDNENHPSKVISFGWTDEDNAKHDFSISKSNCCTDVAYLYSDKKYASFVKDYCHDPITQEKYNYICNNCADAANSVLDYFFPKSCENVFYRAYQTLCCFFCIGTAGLRCLPAPPCINSPNDIFRKAQLLSLNHGTHSEKIGPVPDETRTSESLLSIKLSI